MNNQTNLMLNPNRIFDEKIYSEMKYSFEKAVQEWKLSSTESKQYKKAEEKIIKNYLSSTGFIAWYLIKEKNLSNKFAYNIETNQWLAYELTAPFLWSPINITLFEITIDNLVGEIFPWDLYNQINKKQKEIESILHELKNLLSVNFQDKSKKNYLVMKDKVLNKLTREIIDDCGPQDYITDYSTIPYNPKGKCPQIKNWLNFVFKNDKEMIAVFQSISQVILFSNNNYHLNFFIEVRGGGGTGKSLLGRLLQAIVGPHLRAATNLQKLHNNNYETAALINKYLVLCPDQQAFVSSAEVLKTLTGSDPIRYELKYKNPSQFYFYGIIVILTNAKLTYSSAESAILRRRIAFNFDQIVENVDPNLLNIDNNNNISGKWAPELSGFINWILEPSREKVMETINTYLNKERQNVDEFSFLLWIRTKLLPFKNGKLGIIHDKLGPSLYKNYAQFMEQQGLHPVKAPNFESNMDKDWTSAFPGYSIYKETNRFGKTYVGLAYQSAQFPEIPTPEDQLIFLAKWRAAWQEKIGKNFFGQTTMNNIEELYIDETIWDNIDYRKKLVTIKSSIQSSIGFPRLTKDDIIFNSKTALYFIRGEKANIKIITNKESLFDNFLDLFNYNQKAVITTEELFDLYTNSNKEQKDNFTVSYTDLKDLTIKIWNKKYPNLRLKSIKNIGKKKLKGIQGLELKETPKNQENFTK